MQDYHIRPTDPQAVEAAVHVAAYDRDTYVSIRGDEFGFDRVVKAPDDYPGRDYLWTFVRVGEWLDEFHNQATTAK